ncbi:MAG: amino acid ABC transporter permease [Smithellaceae bacterium]|nr:amino acid ABC transporter permease [Syntrophaceae bacterium]MDD4241305.1 amino acid ABC transporter permease [Smithellaceae bacterium]NLX52963.1 amino acid ABC transporter permease [Deltaproteobacteria bacterium]
MTFWNILLILVKGAGYTVLVTLASIGAGLAVGLLLAVLSLVRWKTVRLLLAAYTYVFRSIPVLVLLFIVFFGLPGMGIRIPPFFSMVLCLGLVSGAYLAEIFRGAMAAVSRDEITAAEAMGMKRVQIFLYVIWPQMFRMAVPGMTNEFTSILKYTPFAYTVGIPEIMKEAMSLAALTLRGLEIYLAVGILYYLIYKVFVVSFETLEKRFRIPGLAGE